MSPACNSTTASTLPDSQVTQAGGRSRPAWPPRPRPSLTSSSATSTKPEWTALLNNGYFTTELINFTAEDRLCIPVPFYHCFGMVMGNLGCTSHGAMMVIPAPGFDPSLTLKAIAEERCTDVYGVPTMFIAMQNAPTSPSTT